MDLRNRRAPETVSYNISDFFSSLLEIVQEAKELVSWLIPLEFAVERFRFAERLLFYRQRGLQIDSSCVEGLVAEPQGDDRAIHTLLQKVHGHGVPQAVDGYAFAFQ